MRWLVRLFSWVHSSPSVLVRALWLALTLIFCGLALEANSGAHVRLPRAGFRLPETQRVSQEFSQFQFVVNRLAENHDLTVVELERALRAKSRSSLWLNLVGALLSLSSCGVFWNRVQRSSTVDAKAANMIDVSQPLFPRAPQQTAATRSPASVTLHDGSFPEGGYEH